MEPINKENEKVGEIKENEMKMLSEVELSDVAGGMKKSAEVKSNMCIPF